MKITAANTMPQGTVSDHHFGQDIHIVPCFRGWALEIEGSSWYYNFFKTQVEAMAEGISMARDGAVSLIIHGKDGRFREVWNYRK